MPIFSPVPATIVVAVVAVVPFPSVLPCLGRLSVRYNISWMGFSGTRDPAAAYIQND